MRACTLLFAALACTAGCSGARAVRPQRSAQEPLEFLFVGASNLPNPDAPHMRRVLITFSDQDHFTEQWTKSENGKDTVFDLHFVRR